MYERVERHRARRSFYSDRDSGRSLEGSEIVKMGSETVQIPLWRYLFLYLLHGKSHVCTDISGGNKSIGNMKFSD